MNDLRSTLVTRSTVFDLSRRTMLGAAAALSGATVLKGWGSAQAPEDAPIENPLLGTTYVGLASDGVTHVAVVQIIGAESAEVRCYLCDGAGRNDWLSGPMIDGPVPLEANGVTVQLRFGEGVVSGDASLGDGQSLTFEATEAAGPDGLYEVGPIAEQMLAGSATSGALIQLQIVGALGDGSRLLAGLASWPDGSVHPVSFVASPDAGGELRIIVVPGGSAAGGPRITSGVSRGSGSVTTSVQVKLPDISSPWIDPTPEPWVDPDTDP